MNTHLEDYIRDLYHSMGIKKPEQIDMFYIAACLGIEVTYRKVPFRLESEIILRRTNKEQEWLDFGHELCHVLRHHGCQLNMHPPYRHYQEWKANNFMYHFCVPTFMLEKIKLPRNKYEAAELVASEFNVSNQFAERRLDIWQRKKFVLLLNQKERIEVNGIL